MWIVHFWKITLQSGNSAQAACLDESEYNPGPFLLVFPPQQVREEAFFPSFAFPLGPSQMERFIIGERT